MVQYCRPRTVGEVLDVLSASPGGARILVGGTDLLVGVRRRPLEPVMLVDLKAVDDLPPALEVSAESVRFGPTATMSDLAANSEVVSRFPALAQASAVVGSLAIRNRASLIGNVCNASPAADTAPALLVYGATVTIVGAGGERTMPLVDFFVGPGATACGQDELVLRIEVPTPDSGHRSAFERLTRRRGVDLATVSVAAGVSATSQITLGLGAVGPTPLLSAVSDPIDLPDESALRTTVERLISVATPISDVRAGREYRQAMTAVLSQRAIQSAAGLSRS